MVLMRKTKIVCTIGPATESAEMLRDLMLKGMNVARLNTTHGEIEQHRKRIERLKELRKSMKAPLTILLDLSGPKIRTGSFSEDTVELIPGKEFRLTTNRVVGDENKVSVNYERLPLEVREGNTILMDDGKIRLKVLHTDNENVYTRIVNGGSITHRRGINLPGINISIPAVTDKDREFIKLGVETGVDYFALSFVRKAEDVLLARDIVKSTGRYIPIISKI